MDLFCQQPGLPLIHRSLISDIFSSGRVGILSSKEEAPRLEHRHNVRLACAKCGRPRFANDLIETENQNSKIEAFGELTRGVIRVGRLLGAVNEGCCDLIGR